MYPSVFYILLLLTLLSECQNVDHKAFNIDCLQNDHNYSRMSEEVSGKHFNTIDY